MRIITFEDMKKFNISNLEAYSWVEEMLLHKDEAYLPPKISMKYPTKPGVFYNVMPSIIPHENVAGVKLVSRYPDASPALNSLLILCDFEDGTPLAFMDANYITAMRTGAVAVHSVKLFANKDFETIGLIGLGNVMRATMKIFADVFPHRNFQIKLYKYKDSHISFMEEFKDNPNFHFEIADTYEDVVRDSDVVMSAATYFDHDICSDDCFKKGVTVLPIHTRGFANCDLFFDKVFADDVGHVRGFKYFDKFKNFAEVHEVICGKKPGRTDRDERILVYNIGISLHDIYYASKIYKKYCTKLPDSDMKAPTEKYWY